MTIVNNVVNDVAIATLPDAPIDPSTGMPYVTIAVATDGGISQIGWDGNGNTDAVWDVTYTSYGASYSIGFSELGLVYSVGAGPTNNGWVHHRKFLTADVSEGAGYIKGTSDEFYSALYSSSYTGLDITYSRSANNGPKSGTLFAGAIGANDGLDIFKRNSTIPSKGMLNKLTTTYLSGHMVGDIRGAWLADTTAETITGAELVTNGTFTTDVSGWTGSNATLALGTANMVVTVTANGTAYAYQAISTVVGKTYTMSFDFVADAVTGNTFLYAGTSPGAANVAYLNAGSITGTYQVTFTAVGTTTYISVSTSSTALAGESYTVDNVSVRLADPDRSVKNNGLQAFGSIVKTPVATGSDLVAYSGFSATDYLQQPYNPDLDFGTGDFCIMGWVKLADNIHQGTIIDVRSDAGQIDYIIVQQQTNGDFRFQTDLSSGANIAFTNNIGTGWVFFVGVRDGDTNRLYINGTQAATAAQSVAGDSFDFASGATGVGLTVAGSTPLNGSLALLRIGATAPSADQIKHIYETEKVLFQDNAKCTLYGTSDAVTDMAYDEITGKLGVLTSSGLSRFDGLRRVSEQAGTFSKVAMNNGLEALI